ncbi:MAG: hypothetical protein Kapaf2KO_18070 [Candidatus Kapaibacteriales bacterium]
MKAHHITAFSGALLIAIGLYSFFSNDTRPLTALIGPLLGLIFILLSTKVKQGHKHITHAVVLLTAVFGVMTSVMAYNSLDLDPGPDRERRIQVFSAMAITCIGAFLYYINGFIERKKLENESSNS